MAPTACPGETHVPRETAGARKYRKNRNPGVLKTAFICENGSVEGRDAEEGGGIKEFEVLRFCLSPTLPWDNHCPTLHS